MITVVGEIILASLRKISDWVDPFAAAKGAPPKTLWAFYLWCTSGSGYVILACILASALLGSMEMAGPWILGALIDRAMAAKPETFWSENWQICLLCVAFFILLKPLLCLFLFVDCFDKI